MVLQDPDTILFLFSVFFPVVQLLGSSHDCFFLFLKFIYLFWPCWVLLCCASFSLAAVCLASPWLPLLQSTALGGSGFSPCGIWFLGSLELPILEHRLSSWYAQGLVTCGISPDQDQTPVSLHCRHLTTELPGSPCCSVWKFFLFLIFPVIHWDHCMYVCMNESHSLRLLYFSVFKISIWFFFSSKISLSFQNFLFINLFQAYLFPRGDKT